VLVSTGHVEWGQESNEGIKLSKVCGGEYRSVE